MNDSSWINLAVACTAPPIGLPQGDPKRTVITF
jgi:hypothetical protein